MIVINEPDKGLLWPNVVSAECQVLLGNVFRPQSAQCQMWI